MPSMARIYLDNAATSWPKPPAVYAAVDDYQRRLGSAAGRSEYPEARETELAIAEARHAVARIIGAEKPDQIIFTFSGTDALNLAIHGLLLPNDHVVTTIVEHNSVLRPLRWLEDRQRIKVTRIQCDESGIV